MHRLGLFGRHGSHRPKSPRGIAANDFHRDPPRHGSNAPPGGSSTRPDVSRKKAGHRVADGSLSGAGYAVLRAEHGSHANPE